MELMCRMTELDSSSDQYGERIYCNIWLYCVLLGSEEEVIDIAVIFYILKVIEYCDMMLCKFVLCKSYT